MPLNVVVLVLFAGKISALCS